MKWNLEILYKSEKDPQIGKDIALSQQKNKQFILKWKNNKRYLKEPDILLEAITEYETLQEKYGQCIKPMYYLILRRELNQTDPKIKAQYNKVTEIATKMGNDIQFFELSISKIPLKKQKEFLNSKILENYKHFLEHLFQEAKYILSDKEERIFNIKGKVSHSNWVNMVSELLNKQTLKIVDEEGEKKKVSYNEISRYINSTDKKVRDIAAKEFNSINTKYCEIAEFEINSILENKRNSDDYRKVPRADLLRHISDDIDSDIVDTLVSVVTENFNISREYYKKKAKLLGLKKLAYHERNIPLKGVDIKYPYAKSIGLVKDTFSKLDSKFEQILNQFQQNGIYDVYPRSGKSGGAFCISVSKALPTYILLNHTNRLSDVLTIAHESGHAIHSILAQKQSELNSGYPIFLAEVASTFFEDFVLEQILSETKEKEIEIGIIDNKLNVDISSIFRQVAFYNFEKELHETFRKNSFVPKEEISEIFCKHMTAYLGDSVKVDEGMRNGWVYVSHFRNFFYVYSYASGLLISKALQSLVKKDPQNISLIKKFLQAGSSKSPKEIFQDMEIDISQKEIWENGLAQVRELLKRI